MKYLVILVLLFSSLAKANDMFGIDVSFGQNSRPSYSVDYEFNKDLPYLDVAVSANRDYVQPYVSAGLQFDHVNLGLATAVSVSNFNLGSFNGQFGLGGEIGYMENLSKTFYVKENNSLLGFPGGVFNFTSTFSIGLNL